MSSPAIFDMDRRSRLRDRAVDGFAHHDFLFRHMAEDVLDRLSLVTRPFRDALVTSTPDATLVDGLRAMGLAVTVCDPGKRWATISGGIRADEDALPFEPESFDLILSCGTLDSINDVPGALIQMRHLLRPDGLLLAALVGAPSFPRLRSALRLGDADTAVQRIHPQIDVRAMGDLLTRAGFALPVVDSDALTIRYGDIVTLMHDLRGMAGGNAMISMGPALTRQSLQRAAEAFAADADPDGRTAEQVTIIHASGWKPDASQPKPARRGSATASLAAALKAPDRPS